MITYLAGIAALVLLREAWRSAARVRRAGFGALAVVCLVVAVAAGPRGAVVGKTLGLLAMPLGLVFVATLVVGYVAFWRGARAWAVTSFILHLAVMVVANPMLANAGLRYVEGEYAALDPYQERPFDAIVVLGGGTSTRPSGEAQLRDSGDRVMLAARLYRRGLAPHLLTSGAPIAGFSSHDSAAATMEMWRDLGIPASAIEQVEGARNTEEEARLHGAIIRERGWRRVGLVTSAFHMTRALRRFEAAGIDVTPLPADVRSEAFAYRGFVSIIPTGDAAETTHTVVWELLGRAVGR